MRSPFAIRILKNEARAHGISITNMSRVANLYLFVVYIIMFLIIYLVTYYNFFILSRQEKQNISTNFICKINKKIIF